MSLAAALCIAGVNAVELDCTFDKKLPAGVSINGNLQQEDGTTVLVNENKYYSMIVTFPGEDNVTGTLTIELTSAGNPAGMLGIILHEQLSNGKTKQLKNYAWMRKVAQDKYQTMTFTIAPEMLKAGKKYSIYFYRNGKGALKIKRVQFKTTPVAK